MTKPQAMKWVNALRSGKNRPTLATGTEDLEYRDIKLRSEVLLTNEELADVIQILWVEER